MSDLELSPYEDHFHNLEMSGKWKSSAPSLQKWQEKREERFGDMKVERERARRGWVGLGVEWRYVFFPLHSIREREMRETAAKLQNTPSGVVRIKERVSRSRIQKCIFKFLFSLPGRRARVWKWERKLKLSSLSSDVSWISALLCPVLLWSRGGGDCHRDGGERSGLVGWGRAEEGGSGPRSHPPPPPPQLDG
jgi:hypothetical protein